MSWSIRRSVLCASRLTTALFRSARFWKKTNPMSSVVMKEVLTPISVVKFAGSTSLKAAAAASGIRMLNSTDFISEIQRLSRVTISLPRAVRLYVGRQHLAMSYLSMMVNCKSQQTAACFLVVPQRHRTALTNDGRRMNSWVKIKEHLEGRSFDKC